MNLDDQQRNMLLLAFSLTREVELDCDSFVEQLAIYVEGNLDDDQRLLFDHHREICPECDEQLQLLLRALGR